MSRLLSLVAASAALLALSACNPCHDACAHEASCNAKLGLSINTDVDTCTSKCEQNTTCLNKDEVESCLSDMKCETALSYLGEVLSCGNLCKTR